MSDATLIELEYECENGNVRGRVKYIMDRERSRCFFMDCSRSVSTLDAATGIVRKIAEREGIQDPLKFYFFDILINRGERGITQSTCRVKMLLFGKEQQGIHVKDWLNAKFSPELLPIFGLRPA